MCSSSSPGNLLEPLSLSIISIHPGFGVYYLPSFTRNTIMSKVVIITGASRGIGAATAVKFAEHGCDVCINYSQNKEAAEQVQGRVESYGVKSIIYQADVSQTKDVEALFENCIKYLGIPKVLVNNAGIIAPQTDLFGLTEQRINSLLTNNVTSALLCSKQAALCMSEVKGGLGGVIVNVSSKASVTGSPEEYIDYAASKGAIDSLTRGMAKELAPHGIRVNGVRPGLIYTEIHEDAGEPDRVDRLSAKIPLGRGGLPEEVAESILWLASDRSSFITGELIDVTGGL